MQTLKLTKKYETYTEYKDSGIEWLGKIPTSWTLEKLKYVAPLVNKKVAKDNLQGIYVALENVESKTGKHIPSGQNVEPESMVNIFEDTDVLFGKLRPYLAKVFAPGFSGTATSEFLVLRPEKKISQKYLFYSVLSQEFINTVNDSTYGAQMPRASWNFIGNLSVTLPSLKEQIQITNYLDKKTAHLDKIIEKKQKQIKLLHEKRAVLIRDELSCDKIQCKTEKIKHIVKSIEAGIWGENPIENSDDIKCLRVADFDYENLSFFDVETIRNNSKLQTKKILRYGDILMEKSGGGEKTPVGRAIHFNSMDKMVCANFIDIVRVDKQKVLPEFLVLILSALYSERVNTKYIKQNTGIQNMDIKSYFGEMVSFPVISMQKDIVDIIHKKMSSLKEVITKIEKTIGILQEFKSSLISDTVTGKIKI